MNFEGCLAGLALPEGSILEIRDEDEDEDEDSMILKKFIFIEVQILGIGAS